MSLVDYPELVSELSLWLVLEALWERDISKRLPIDRAVVQIDDILSHQLREDALRQSEDMTPVPPQNIGLESDDTAYQTLLPAIQDLHGDTDEDTTSECLPATQLVGTVSLYRHDFDDLRTFL